MEVFLVFTIFSFSTLIMPAQPVDLIIIIIAVHIFCSILKIILKAEEIAIYLHLSLCL
jgi:hypothetical protein